MLGVGQGSVGGRRRGRLSMHGLRVRGLGERLKGRREEAQRLLRPWTEGGVIGARRSELCCGRSIHHRLIGSAEGELRALSQEESWAGFD